MDNPLLESFALPPFSRILPEHVEPAVTQLLADNRALVNGLLDRGAPFTWANLVEPIELAEDRLSRAWAPVGHLNSVLNSDALRDAYNACLPLLSDYGTEMGQNERLYRAYKEVLESSADLDAIQTRVLENALRDFHLSGVDLPPAQKERFKEISQRMSQITSQFSDNVLDATNGWSKRIDDAAQLAGLPQSALDLARQTAEQRGESGWTFTLDFPSYYPILTYADDRALRREFYEAYTSRASEIGPNAGQWDNGPLMEEILSLRHEMAQLLGFANYAERSLARKMAPSTEAVVHFLTDLAVKSRAQAQRELEEVRAFARAAGADYDLELWDIGYWSEKLKEQRYAITQEELKPWFPAPKVIDGLFAIVQRLFNVTFVQIEGADLWHPDVRFYEIRDPDGTPRGQFYFDLYARPQKRGGAWMDDCQPRFRTADRLQLPVAFLTCNFTPPVGDKPSLLTHSEVETLFHEFGHGLHHMLTRIDLPAVAGISGVEWDAVELPSQFLENWCWEPEAMGLISGHWETGEPLPAEKLQKMLAAKHFQTAMQMVRQLEFSLFDFRLHREYDPARGGRVYEILGEVREQVAVVPYPEFNRMPHSFSHIFAGGYAAGYYSYKWAEVLSADAFSLFEEKGIFDPETGRSFLTNILEKGGSKNAMELFTAFRGREPSIEPLLRHSGIAA